MIAEASAPIRSPKVQTQAATRQGCRACGEESFVSIADWRVKSTIFFPRSRLTEQPSERNGPVSELEAQGCLLKPGRFSVKTDKA
jgi:hypothetical protein